MVKIDHKMELLAVVGHHPVALADIEQHIDAVVVVVVGKVNEIRTNVDNRPKIAGVPESICESFLQVLFGLVSIASHLWVAQEGIGIDKSLDSLLE